MTKQASLEEARQRHARARQVRQSVYPDTRTQLDKLADAWLERWQRRNFRSAEPAAREGSR